jgi:hypothetical protein
MNFFSQTVVLNAEFDVQQEMEEWFDKRGIGERGRTSNFCPEYDGFYAYRFRFKFSLGLVGLLERGSLMRTFFC